MLLINHPSALAAALATGTAVSAAIINVAFDFFAGEEPEKERVCGQKVRVVYARLPNSTRDPGAVPLLRRPPRTRVHIYLEDEGHINRV